MIDMNAVSADAWKYAVDNFDSFEDRQDFYCDLMLLFDMLEREDDKNGTNRLEELLDKHDVAWFVEEYGVVLKYEEKILL